MRDGYAGWRRLGEDAAGVHFGGVQGLDGYSGVGVAVEKGVVEGGGAVEAGGC